MSQIKLNTETSRRLARELFHNKVVDALRTSVCPSEAFIDSCFDANLSVGETLRRWTNRFA